MKGISHYLICYLYLRLSTAFDFDFELDFSDGKKFIKTGSVLASKS